MISIRAARHLNEATLAYKIREAAYKKHPHLLEMVRVSSHVWDRKYRREVDEQANKNKIVFAKACERIQKYFAKIVKRNQLKWSKFNVAQKDAFMYALDFRGNVFDTRGDQLVYDFGVIPYTKAEQRTKVEKWVESAGTKAELINNGMAGSSAYMLHYGGSAWTFETAKQAEKFVERVWFGLVEIAERESKDSRRWGI